MSIDGPGTKPTFVYLDSCDYSALSKPQLAESEAQQLATLKALKRSGDAVFVFSLAHISEMSPLDHQHSTGAVSRTKLLVDLFCRNTVISVDRLMKAELSRLVARNPQPVGVIDTNGQWFPDMGSLISPLDELDLVAKVQEETDKYAFNRKTRRMLKSSVTNKRGNIRNEMKDGASRMDYSDLTDRVPMRLQDFTVIKNFALGRASREEAEKAFLESLRDPSYMAQWFIHHHHQLGAIVEWVRRPAKEIQENCNETAKELREQLAEFPVTDRAEARKRLSGTPWAELKQRGMINIVNRQLKILLPGSPVCDDISAIEEYCPGIFVCLSALFDSLQHSHAERYREMKASDFVDFIHALYIPYVSYFRADKYMCSILQPLAKRFGTQVVASPAKLITELPEPKHRII